MKKILFFSHAMEIGGAERALLGLLENIDTNKYCVDLFLMRHEGDLIESIPQNINLLPEIPQYTCLAVPIKRVLKKGQIGIALGRIIGKHKAQKKVAEMHFQKDNCISIEYSHKYTKRYMPIISNNEYDLAISFLTPHYFVDEKVKAKKKIAWIHTDYDNVKVDTESELKMWEKYDNIISISDKVTDSFLKTFPSLASKILVLENIMPIKCIRQQAEEIISDNDMMQEDDVIKLLSVGRFTEAKNFDNVPEICRIIKNTGLNVKWYLIGYGGDEPIIRERIKENQMENDVIILGKKTNPYPYIKACDLYVQPSRYEGNCVSVHEAQILHKPVVITDYATSGSQLTDGFDGVVVPMNNQGCADGIIKVLNDKELMKTLSENTKKVDYTNSKEVGKLYTIMGD